jgi:hypothetical protein
MTIKVDGTNGVLQTYDFQVLTTGFTYTFAAGTTTLIANPAGTLATGTITMPAAPADGMVITIESTQQITALTVAANTGQSLVGGTVTLRQNQPLSFMYRITNTTWYPFAGNSNSDIISGTAVASTSGTSIDFTSIPSWVRRVTVMFSGVSLNGASEPMIQIGTGASPTTSGYAGRSAFAGASAGTVGYGAGFITFVDASASNTLYGQAILNLLNSSTNTWAYTAMFAASDVAYTTVGGGSVPLSGSLNMVRITTVNGTDTFDAGSINILYE